MGAETWVIWLHVYLASMAHLTTDALLFQLLCGLQVVAYHFAISNKCDVGAFSLYLLRASNKCLDLGVNLVTGTTHTAGTLARQLVS